jgi:two-component system sensor histidine kinase PilS (NtrC family)
MSSAPSPRAATSGPRSVGLPVRLVARWLMGLRLVAVSAILIGTLLAQVTTSEILPIAPLIRIVGLSYVLSLAWIALWLMRIPVGLHASLQLAGDLVIIAVLVHFTGGLSSPFPFLFLVPVGLAALMFGLRGALTVAGAAFVLYAAMAEAVALKLLPPSAVTEVAPSLRSSSLVFQLVINAAGFVLVALLTSYLAHSLQQAEARLLGEREASARLLALSADVLRSVESGVLAADNEGSVVLANPAAQTILATGGPLEGRRLEELLSLDGKIWPELLSQVQPDHPLRLEASAIGPGAPMGCTVTALGGEDSAPLGVVVHFRDLTEAREAASRERLRERLVAVGEMAAGIAHEIRNPLASISGSAQVLGNLPGLTHNGRRLLQIVVEESRRLSGIIEAFLGYARPPDPRPGPCDIARTLEETLTLFAHSPEVTPAHVIELDIKPHPATVTADERQLRQAFFNLARNAIQAMPQGGTMRVQAQPEAESYVIRWSDHGIGMQPQQIQEIFQPFRAFRRGGTGLGLSVVYSIVSDHNGSIKVASQPGEGSTFTIRLPLEAS